MKSRGDWPFAQSLSALVFVVSTGVFAQSSNTNAWFNRNLLLTEAAVKEWGLKKAPIELTNADYMMVTSDAAIMAGRKFIEKVASEKDRDALLQFVLLHEYRHVYQLHQGAKQAQRVLECDADFHAALRLATMMLDSAPKDQADATIGKVLDLQRFGPRLNSLTTAAGHEHLTPDQRFQSVAFASWRAIHQWMLRTGLSGSRYSEIRERALSFVEPSSASDAEWSINFCLAMINGRQSERNKLTMTPRNFELLESDNGQSKFKHIYEIRNSGDWPLRVTGWQLTGIRAKNAEDDFTQYTAGQSNTIDVVIAAHESVNVTWVQLTPRASKTMEVFIWPDSSFTPMVLTAVRSGPRVEPPNCQAAWTDPEDKDTAELFTFLLRTGNVASRSFVGVRGEVRESSPPAPIQFFGFTVELPRLASADKDRSYVAMRRGGVDASAHIQILQTESLPDAERIYNAMVGAMKMSCGVDVVQDGNTSDGDRRFLVNRLTPLSSAALYLSTQEPKEPGGRKRYSVSWNVHPIEE